MKSKLINYILLENPLDKNSKEIATITEHSLIIGCNYHTTWQTNAGMRFVLKEIKNNMARLVTRNTNSDFWTHVSDLRFIMTKPNIIKAKYIILKNNGTK